ncbi:hypothetical protein K443DRAFT_364120 [Laccaria amethystina LaAM-08-1]|uniref:Uncharacterized protein n=1 Tax=Laccaria amethystina LaAM-08-1 TaxID=1095629 RepID=A0A0C9WJA0_9AGAR|nr:hypothetical protein K443DRAFT_364120 [Laccaria amethystina LaAM-08-1]
MLLNVQLFAVFSRFLHDPPNQVCTNKCPFTKVDCRCEHKLFINGPFRARRLHICF